MGDRCDRRSTAEEDVTELKASACASDGGISFDDDTVAPLADKGSGNDRDGDEADLAADLPNSGRGGDAIDVIAAVDANATLDLRSGTVSSAAKAAEPASRNGCCCGSACSSRRVAA